MSHSNIKTRKRNDNIFHGILILSVLFSLSILVALFGRVIVDGISHLTPEFIFNYTSRLPSQAGVAAALAGSIWVIVITIIIAFPLGVGTALYLEEYAAKNKLSSLIQININNLAGIPSVVYGIFGLTLFVRLLGLGRSIMAGSLTMALLILPLIIVSSQESLKTVPRELKEASYGLGVSKWDTIMGVIIPYSMPGILTGTILAISRALGEAAPLLLVGGAAAIWFSPSSPLDQFTTLPLQIYSWAGKPQAEFQNVASAGIILLLGLLILTNLTAILLRNKYQDRIKR
jgi:phosphate transport system permease protein